MSSLRSFSSGCAMLKVMAPITKPAAIAGKELILMASSINEKAKVEKKMPAAMAARFPFTHRGNFRAVATAAPIGKAEATRMPRIML